MKRVSGRHRSARALCPGPWILAAIAALLLPACTRQTDLLREGPAAPPRFEAVLQPRVDGHDKVTGIAVDSVIYGGLKKGAERLRLTAPVVYYGAYGIADRVMQLEVTDRHGTVRLDHKDDPASPGGFPYFRHWQARRAVSFPVRVRYFTAVEGHTDRRGPPFNIKPTAGGVSGAGSAFLVVPENADSTFSRVRWDLSAFRTFASGISSWGMGEFELSGAPKELWQGWYMAGPLGRWPAIGDANGFSATWLGHFPFDPAVESKRLGAVYAWLADFFGYLSPSPRYRVFMRIIDSKLTHFSGTELGASFMLSGGPRSGEETNGAAPRGTLIHEMIHMWVGQVEGPQGVKAWFSEGLTSYYTLVLPLRGGFESVADYGAAIGRLTERYYTSPALHMSAEDIARVGFRNEEIRSTPYARGTMYFADLDARIRARSNGKRNLDDVTLAIFRRRHDEPAFKFDRNAWMQAISAELGPQAALEFKARVLGGEGYVPVSNAFGPCFERRPATYETEDGGEVPGYQWTRKSGVPDTACAGG